MRAGSGATSMEPRLQHPLPGCMLYTIAFYSIEPHTLATVVVLTTSSTAICSGLLSYTVMPLHIYCVTYGNILVSPGCMWRCCVVVKCVSRFIKKHRWSPVFSLRASHGKTNIILIFFLILIFFPPNSWILGHLTKSFEFFGSVLKVYGWGSVDGAVTQVKV